MAKPYQPPELAPVLKNNGALPLSESNQTILVKFHFQGTRVPYGIPQREQRDAFPTVGHVRQDTGVCVIQRNGVSAQLLRTGLANADGHAWKLISIAQWQKTITDVKMRQRMEQDGQDPTQTVVQLVYQAHPDESRGPIELSREVRDAITILSRQFAWTARVWFNDAGPITVNFTSPTEDDPKVALVVREGALTTIPVEVKAV